MAEEWFRRKTWTQEDREAFFARLKRSRGLFHKAQYLRVQAYELAETGKQEAIAAALALIEMLIRDYPVPFELACATSPSSGVSVISERSRGGGGVVSALTRGQRALPNVHANAHLSFAWLVATKPFPELYREALDALDEFGDSDGFLPASQYKSSGASLDL